jgi:ADP-ribose pyrophosphatase
VARDKVWHPGAVGILAYDHEHVWLTRQPREAAGLADSLEIPAGKLDVEGEEPLACAQRELAEEIAKTAATWTELKCFYTSPGFSDERVWLFQATDLADTQEPAEADEDERIEIVPWPRDRLGAAVDECEDSKTLIALLWLLSRPPAS